MNKLEVLSIVVLSVLCLASSCKDKKPAPTQNYCSQSGTCETVMEAKDYFVFNMGSWWVYEEETTHQRDSLYVIEYANDSDSPDFDVTIYSELEDMRYHYFPLIVYANGCQYPTVVSEKKCLYVKLSKGNFGNYIGENACFFMQHKKGDYTGIIDINHPNDKLTVYDVYPNYELSGFNFNLTVKMHADYDYLENSEPTNHFYSKGVGLIRKELINSNQIWNLVSYHIEP